MRAGLRIVGGEFRGRRLKAPPGIRPATDRTKEVLFSSLAGEIEGRPFVDLYAGSGAVGLEALSRGASRALFVELRRRHARVIRENIQSLGLEDVAEVWVGPVEKLWPRVVQWLAGEPAVIFAGPPYASERAIQFVSSLIQSGGLAEGSIVILERSVRSAEPAVQPQWRRRVGETELCRWTVGGQPMGA